MAAADALLLVRTPTEDIGAELSSHLPQRLAAEHPLLPTYKLHRASPNAVLVPASGQACNVMSRGALNIEGDLS